MSQASSPKWISSGGKGGSAPQRDLEAIDHSHLLLSLLPELWNKRSTGGSYSGPDQEVTPINSIHILFPGTQTYMATSNGEEGGKQTLEVILLLKEFVFFFSFCFVLFSFFFF